MRRASRQRIIALGLLVILLLILVPWALQVPDSMQLQLDAEPPPPPAVSWQPLTPPVSDKTVEQTRQVIDTQRQALIASKQDKTNPMQAFALELHRYDNQEAAEKTRQALNDAGYHAYVRDKQGVFVLYAGPDLNKKRLQKQALRISEDKRFHFSGTHIVYYQP